MAAPQPHALEVLLPHRLQFHEVVALLLHLLQLHDEIVLLLHHLQQLDWGLVRKMFCVMEDVCKVLKGSNKKRQIFCLFPREQIYK